MSVEKKRSSGFTLLESLLAIGILVTVFSQIVGVQASSLAVAKNTSANIQATWALRALSAQVEYMSDVKGVKGLPPETSGPGPVKLNGEDEEAVRFEYKNRQTPIKASKFLLASVRLGQGLVGGSDDSEGGDKFKQFGEMLDSQLPDDIYRAVTFTAFWNDGQQQRSMDLGMLLIDRKSVHIGIPGLTK
ncbi:type II secretion system protein [bacterium]|nr:type II secretion system protein [bacterium]